jgi:hypothetical protein
MKFEMSNFDSSLSFENGAKMTSPFNWTVFRLTFSNYFCDFFNFNWDVLQSAKMPGVISVYDFVRETREDYNSPTTSNFVNRIPQCKETVTKLEEVRSELTFKGSSWILWYLPIICSFLHVLQHPNNTHLLFHLNLNCNSNSCTLIVDKCLRYAMCYCRMKWQNVRMKLYLMTTSRGFKTKFVWNILLQF